MPPASPLSIGGNNGSINLTAKTANGVNNSRIGNFVYLSPEEYFFANPTTLYVADSGQPKNGNANKAALGEGGLQKWSLVDGTSGCSTMISSLVLNLVNNATANAKRSDRSGRHRPIRPDRRSRRREVELFATSYGLNELSPSYLYEITDTLVRHHVAQASGEMFTTLYSAPCRHLASAASSFAPGAGAVDLGDDADRLRRSRLCGLSPSPGEGGRVCFDQRAGAACSLRLGIPRSDALEARRPQPSAGAEGARLVRQG